MKTNVLKSLLTAIVLGIAIPASAQFDLGKAIGAGIKAIQAATITDKEMAAYVKESVDWMDSKNQIAPANDPYSIRLEKLTEGLNDVNGIPLNFKVYKTTDVNAFACADGSVRVFSSLMDIMTDDELLGIIGHEIGHVAKHHSKNAFRNELLGDALKDGVASAGGKAALLTESQLVKLGETFANAKYSQKQETEADDYGYDFLLENGKNPWGMVQAFEKLQAIEQQGGSEASESYVSKMFSDHPDTAERIKHISERCIKAGIPRPGTTNATTETTNKATVKASNKATNQSHPAWLGNLQIAY
ncbi:MAG: M48 family metallopeptidase [Bacteroides sp.]|nr:M48 family metallopeptidase [Bacteroides sp.]